MFKKTRLRIFALIMAIATLVLALMLMFIYIANSRDSFQRSLSLLESYVMEQTDDFHPEGEMGPEPKAFRPGMKDDHKKMFQLSTFYSVLYDPEGQVIRVNVNDGKLYSEQEIIEIGDNILNKGEECGKYNGMPYLVRVVREGKLVALIDNTMEKESFDSMFVNGLVVGFLAWCVILALSWIFSKRIVYPLEQNDIKQKQFISDAGHELKTPISVISANADILSLEIGENKWLANIQYENARMGSLVKQLLTLVRAENRTQTKSRVDFSRLVSGDALPFESVAFDQGHVLHIEVEDDICVEGDQDQLSQVVSILIDNAIHHSPEGKEVCVRLSSVKNHAVLSVINAGTPIPEDIRDRLFERFYRADEARSEDQGHYGLGLAIAKAIVTAHNGKLDLDCYDGLIEFKFTISKI